MFSCPNCNSDNINVRLQKCFDCNKFYEACSLCGNPEIFDENEYKELLCINCFNKNSKPKKKDRNKKFKETEESNDT